MFGVTTISCKIVKKINVDDDDDEEEEEEEEEKHAKKNILPDEWHLLFEEYQQREKIVVSHGLQKNYRLNWPFLA